MLPASGLAIRLTLLVTETKNGIARIGVNS